MTKTRARSISHLKPGEEVTLRFHGSKQIGNDPYELSGILEGFTEDKTRAVFGGDADVEVYKFNGRWSYGSGAHPVSIVATEV